MAASKPIHYHAEPAAARLVEPLDMVTLVYQRRSGITHIVAEPVPEMLEAMGDDAVTPVQLAERLSAQFDLGSEDDAEAVIAARLEELADLGLVFRV